MPEVDSSAIAKIEHDPRSMILTVWFHGRGAPYEYFGVPARVYEAFLASESKGRFFNEWIRDQYQFSRPAKS